VNFLASDGRCVIALKEPFCDCLFIQAIGRERWWYHGGFCPSSGILFVGQGFFHCASLLLHRLSFKLAKACKFSSVVVIILFVFIILFKEKGVIIMPDLNLILKAAGFALMAAGFIIVYAAKAIVDRYNLDRNVLPDFENDMNGEEVKKYAYDRTVLNVKLTGMLIALPGIIMVILSFKSKI